MLRSTVRRLGFAVLLCSAFIASRVFAQDLAITSGDSTLSIGRIEWPLIAVGGTGTGYKWSVVNGALPPGLSIRTDTPPWFGPNITAGLIGVATTPDTYTFTLQVTDSADNSATKPVTIKILRLVMTENWELADTSKGVLYSKALTVAGATGPVSFLLQPGQELPEGLTLDASTGIIAGTPTAPGTYDFQLDIGDSTGTISRGFRLHVSPLRILAPDPLPNGTQGSHYSQAIGVTGGIEPYSYSVNCCMPDGLSLNPAIGLLSGTPEYPGFWSFTVEIADSAGARLRKHFQLGVVGIPPVLPALSSNTFDDLTIGEFTAWSLGISGGTPPYSWSVTDGELPPGVSVRGVPDPPPFWNVWGAWLVGTPTELGVYTFTVEATDSSSPVISTRQTYTLRVSPLSLDGLPNALFGAAYSQRIRVLGGEPPYTITKTAGTVPAGLALDGTALLSGTPAETGNLWFQVRATDKNGVSFTRGAPINIDTNPLSSVNIQRDDLLYTSVNTDFGRDLRAWGGTGAFSWTVLSSSLPSWLSLSSSSPGRLHLSGWPTSTGDYSFTVQATDLADPVNFCVRTVRLTVTPLRMAVSTNLAWGNAGNPYSTALSVTGGTGAVTWSVEPGYLLPDGMSLSADGVLSGTPASAGQYWIQLRATDATGASASWGFSLAIYPPGLFPPVSISTPTALGTYSIGRLQIELHAQGGNGSYTWNLLQGKLPTGLSLRTDKPAWFAPQASAGLIGVATTPGTYSFTLQVASGSSTFTREFTINIVSLTERDPSTLPEAFAGHPYSYAFSSNSPGNVSWSVQPGSLLPPGLTLSAHGILSGTPTTANSYWFNIDVSDVTSTVSRSYYLRVQPFGITTSRFLPNATQGTPYNLAFAASGASGGITWNASWTPAGLTLLPNGVLAGTPTQAGTTSFYVTATDASHQFYQAYFTLNVVGVPPILPSISMSTYDLTLGNSVSIGISASGGTAPYTWSATGLPPGMSLQSGAIIPAGMDAAGAMLWGTPMALGTFNVSVSALESSAQAVATSQTYPVKVTALAADGGDFPYGTRGSPYQATLRVIGGTLPYVWTIANGVLPAGLSLDSSTGVVSGTPLENGWLCPQIRVTDAAASTYTTWYCFQIGGGTTTIDINNGYSAGSTTVSHSYWGTLTASGAPSFIWSLEAGSALPPGINLSPDGVLSGTPTVTGVYSFHVRAADANYPANYGVRRLILTVTPLELSWNNLPGWANVGSPYSNTPTVSGNAGSVLWSVGSGSILPPGLTLDPTTGTVSGVPASAGNYYISLVALDIASDTSQSTGYSIAFYPPGQSPPLFLGLGPDLGPATKGQVSYTLQASGGSPPYTYSYSPGAIPIPGVRVQDGQPLPTYFPATNAGGLLGVVTVPGAYSTSIRIADSKGQTYDRAITLRVSAIMPLSNGSLPRATIGMPFEFGFKATGGNTSYTWSVQPGYALPPGLSLTPAGVLSGTPAVAGTYGFLLNVADNAGDYLTFYFNLEVMPFQIVTESQMPLGTLNSPYSVTLGAIAAGVTWSMYSGSLPSGLSLNSSSGEIYGVPTLVTSRIFTVRATAAGGEFSLKTFSLTIVNSTPQPLAITSMTTLSDYVIGWSITTPLYATGGSPPYSWALDPGSTLPPGIELISDGGTVCNSCGPRLAYIAGRFSDIGDYAFTLRVTDSAPTPNLMLQTFVVHVAPVTIDYTYLPIYGTSLVAGIAYSQAMLGYGGTGTYAWAAAGPMPPGLDLSADGTVHGTPIDTGSLNVPVRIDDGVGGIIQRNVTFYIVSGAAATLNFGQAANLGTVSQGSSYGINMSVFGSPLQTPNYAISALTGLPPGCSLLTGEALFSGNTTPARLACNFPASGTFTFTLRAVDAAGNFGVRTFTLRVIPNAIFTALLVDAAAGMPYSQHLFAWGAAGTWSVAPGSSLPPGLALSPDGTLSGTPNSPGSYTFTVRLTDASGLYLSRTFGMTIADLAIIDPALIPAQATLGEPFTYTFTAQGGGTSKTWSLSSGGLPYGMNLSSTGTLSGTCAMESDYTFDIQVTDGSATFIKTFTLIVRHKYPWLRSGANPTVLPDVALGQSFATMLSSFGGVPPYVWTVAPDSSLPAGLALVQGADYYPPYLLYTYLGGIPTTAGQFTFTLRLTDSTGASTQRTYTLNVSSLSLIAGTLRSATFNTAYSQTLTAVGGTAPISFSVKSGMLPPGLSLSPTGVISGMPTNTGNWSFRVGVSDAGGQSYARSYSMFVNALTPQTLNISTGPGLSDISIGSVCMLSLSASGGVPPYGWTLVSGALPPGISLVTGAAAAAIGLSPNNTYLAGRTVTPGTSTFVLRVEDSAGNEGYKTFTQRVSPLQVLPPTTLNTVTGAPVSVQLTAVGGTPPHTFALAAGSYMPLELTLNSNGSVTGAAPESGSYSFMFTVTDASGNSLTRSFNLRVYAAGMPIPLQVGSQDGIHLGGSTDTASAGADFLQLVAADRGVPPYTMTLTSGSLPAGMAIVNGSAFTATYLTGAPASPGDYGYSVRIIDYAGQQVDLQGATRVVPLRIAPDPPPPAFVNTWYSVTFVPTGGTGPYSLQLSPSSALPPGLSLAGMTLSGTPTAPGQFMVSYTLRDSLGTVLPRYFTINVDSAVTPLRALSTSPANVQVTCYTGAPPAPVPITIQSGAASVNFAASVAGIAGATLSASSGATPQSINLLLPGGLATGTYYGVIEINSPQAPNSPLPVRVIVNVVPPPLCSYTVSPATASIVAAGGTGSFSVNALSNCGWSASVPLQYQYWIKITSPASGSGSGTVTYSLSPNGSTLSRTGTISAGGQIHTITQFGSTCAFAINPSALTIPASGGNVTLGVNASLANCPWTASSNQPSWIQVTSGASGTGSGNVGLIVAANSVNSSRSGSVSIAGVIFNVSQSAAGCTVSLSGSGADIPASGGAGAVDVVTNGCAYATIDGPGWITVTSGGSSPGSATLEYSVAANSSTQARSGSLLVGGQPFQIVQAGVACSFTINGSSTLFGASGGTGSIAVTPNGANCGWTASSLSGSPPWLAIDSGSTGTGSGQVSFSLGPNPSSEGRSGSIVVAGQTVTVSQSGAVCGYILRSSEGIIPAAGGTSVAGVVSAAGCSWTAVSNTPSWIQITSGGTGSGSGDVIYSAQPNPSPALRSGTITVADQTYTVTQPGMPCTYTLVTTSTTVGPDGAPPGTPGATFSFTANQAGCSPAAVSFAGWITVTTAFSGTSGTVTFAAEANPLTNMRSGAIQLGDQIFTIRELAANCSYSLNAYGMAFDSAGGSGEVQASASAVGCTPAVGASPELYKLLGLLSQDPESLIWTQPFTVPQFDSLTRWIRVLQISLSGELFTIKQSSWQ